MDQAADRQPLLEPLHRTRLWRLVGRSVRSWVATLGCGLFSSQPIRILVSDRKRRAAGTDSAAPDLGGCGRRYRIASRGRGRTSRHSRPDAASGMQPRWVQMPITTSHWSWPGLTRVLVGLPDRAGSRRRRRAPRRSPSGVRWLMKIGLLRQNTLMICPSAIGRKVDLDRRAGRDGRGVRVHLRDQRHQRGGRSERADGAGRDIEKIAARRLGRRHGCHVCDPFLIPQARPRGRPPWLPPRPERRAPPGSGGRTCRAPSRGQEAKRHDQRRSIGTLDAGAQVRHSPDAQSAWEVVRRSTRALPS